MARYFFHVGGSVQAEDRTGHDIHDPLELRAQALVKAAEFAAREARNGKESIVVVTVRDTRGAVCLKVRLMSQVDVP